VTLDEILNDDFFTSNIVEYSNHFIEKIGLCYQIRQKQTGFLIFETDLNGTIDYCKQMIDKFNN
jgi:hypothetical protein